LETALPVCLQVLVRDNGFPLSRLVELLTVRPAQVLKLAKGTLAEGVDADITLFDPEEEWTYDAVNGFSKSANSPWHGQKLQGRVKATIVAGRPVYRDGKILG